MWVDMIAPWFWDSRLLLITRFDCSVQGLDKVWDWDAVASSCDAAEGKGRMTHLRFMQPSSSGRCRLVPLREVKQGWMGWGWVGGWG